MRCARECRAADFAIDSLVADRVSPSASRLALSTSANPAVRVVLALASCVAGAIGSIVVIALTGGPDLAGAILSFSVLLLGFLGLSLTRVPSPPWRPLRMALGIAAVISLALLLSLPFPPYGWEGTSAVLWLTVLLTSVAASAFVYRAPWMTSVLLVPLGIAACAIVFRFVEEISAVPRAPIGPALAYAYVISASTGAAWLSALWHGRALLAEIPRRRTSREH